MNDFVVQKLTEDDVPFVFEIEKKLLAETDVQKIKNTILSETLSYYVLKQNGKVIGFFECLIIAPEVELYDIAIDEKFHGNGYSKILMDYLINLSKKNKCETIFLEVNSINKVAISLYEKYGFEVYGLRKNYYGDNDAVLMKKSLI